MKLWLIKQGLKFGKKHWKKILIAVLALILLAVAGAGYVFMSIMGGVITPLSFGAGVNKGLYNSYTQVESDEGVNWPDMAAYDAFKTNGTFDKIDRNTIQKQTAQKFIYWVTVCDKNGCWKEKRFYTLEEVMKKEGFEEKDINYAIFIQENIVEFLPDAPRVPGSPISPGPGSPGGGQSNPGSPGAGDDPGKVVPIDPEIIKNNQFIWPVPSTGRISSPFGVRIHPVTHVKKSHLGLDIANHSLGKPVIAAADGTVYQTRSAADGNACGNWIRIKHEDGYMTRYCHLQSILVKSGQDVSQGDTIATVGATGRVTGPHLHFEIKFNGTTINPLPFIEKTRPKGR
ncbi:MAG: M23 family metallopeptidase [Bacillota bacterium]